MSAQLKLFFLNTQPKHMLWILKRAVSVRRFFEHPKHMLKLMDKKISTILRSKMCNLTYVWEDTISEKSVLPRFFL